ncbi:hypothetical protein ACFU44_31840 [Nocardia rhizosphaerihabitans]|uniref:hypothetical protein n=1 Tax=Nocardia rhizosphaerihabitans TaxID=1691570 RepID=UPI003671199D
MTSVGVMPRPARRRPRPPGWWLAMMVVVTAVTWLAAVILLITQAVDADLLVAFYVVVTIVAVGIPWFVLALFGLVQYRAVAVSSILPLILMGTMVAINQRFPERVAWWLSEGAMTVVAQECVARAQPTWIGVYRVDSVRRNYDGACLFRVGDAIGTSGFAYFAPGTAVPERTKAEAAIYYLPFDESWHKYDYNYW